MSKSDDLIYKQDSIDAINRCMEIYINNLQTMIYKIDAYKALTDLPSVQQEIIRCKDCKNSEHWYGDRRRCFLWSEDGVSVFNDGFCNYAERRTDEQRRSD